MRSSYEVIVVGGGHAGCEAALAAARLGRDVLLLTNDLGAVGRMSCNPAIGGLAKGQVVREIDALGGAMGRVADRTGIQFKVLNASRGPSVQGLRCQSDKALYATEMRRTLDECPSLSLGSGTASGFLVDRGRLSGILLEEGTDLRCGAAVVTSGTFLRGLIHVGETRRAAGRWDEPPATTLSDALRALGLRLGRMKTGTPPRVRSSSIDRSRMSLSNGDEVPRPFSFRSRGERFPVLPQEPCWLTHTTAALHELIRQNLSRSPLYSGAIVGRGPRYCPSIEDKVVRFPDKERHQIFVEPEGLSTDWLYLNGLSTSLPADLQEGLVRSIPGLEKAEILRPGYAVEYDMVYPDQLDDTLELRALPGLFLAGQINGTSGYEEAAGQGLVAGVNAARRARAGEAPAFVLKRHEAYIGVMIDDLVTLGTEEPYRLLSSRAEHRLLLGAESAYARLTPKGLDAGLLSAKEAGPILEAEARIRRVKDALEAEEVFPDRETVLALSVLGVGLSEKTTVAGLLKRPDVEVRSLFPWIRELLCDSAALRDLDGLRADELERIAQETRHEAFRRHEEETIRRVARSGEKPIPAAFSYRGLPGLSLEAVEKLERHRPRTIGQAGRIPGVPPSAVTLLLAHVLVLEKRGAAA